MSDLDKRLDAIPVQYAELEFGRLAYRDSGSGPPVVFLHGIGSGSASWVRQFEDLAQDYRCIAWDAPGYGESTTFAVDAPRVSEYVSVLRVWLEIIGVHDYHLVAHSLGALTAGVHCQPNVDLPQTLTFIDPTLGYGARSDSERTKMANRRMRMFDELGAAGLAEERGPALLSRTASAEALEMMVRAGLISLAVSTTKRLSASSGRVVIRALAFSMPADIRVSSSVASPSTYSKSFEARIP